jgi:hypothetical protein
VTGASDFGKVNSNVSLGSSVVFGLNL